MDLLKCFFFFFGYDGQNTIIKLFKIFLELPNGPLCSKIMLGTNIQPWANLYCILKQMKTHMLNQDLKHQLCRHCLTPPRYVSIVS